MHIEKRKCTLLCYTKIIEWLVIKEEEIIWLDVYFVAIKSRIDLARAYENRTHSIILRIWIK